MASNGDADGLRGARGRARQHLQQAARVGVADSVRVEGAFLPGDGVHHRRLDRRADGLVGRDAARRIGERVDLEAVAQPRLADGERRARVLVFLGERAEQRRPRRGSSGRRRARRRAAARVPSGRRGRAGRWRAPRAATRRSPGRSRSAAAASGSAGRSGRAGRARSGRNSWWCSARPSHRRRGRRTGRPSPRARGPASRARARWCPESSLRLWTAEKCL